MSDRSIREALLPIAYERWRGLPWQKVLDEMAMLFHLAVQIEDVTRLDKIQRNCPADERCGEVPCPCGFWDAL